MRPKLTIAIPTYNRSEKLRRTLMLVIQYSQNRNIEILVSDNASTDHTKEVVEAIQKEHTKIQYFRNEENLGFDGNFLNCFERATGEYVWLLSDDDYLLPGAIDSVLEGCKCSPICMHLNSSGIKNENPLIVGNARFKECGLIEYVDKNEFLEKIGIYCTFVSSLVFNLDYVRNVDHKEKYYETNILQSHILLEIMKNDGVYIVNTFNCLAAQGNDVVHYDVLKTWVKNYSELLLTTAVNCGFDNHRMSELLRVGLSTTVYGFVIRFRQTCTDEEKWDRDCIWPYLEKYPELIIRYRKVINCPKSQLRRIERWENMRRRLRIGNGSR